MASYSSLHFTNQFRSSRSGLISLPLNFAQGGGETAATAFEDDVGDEKVGRDPMEAGV